VQQRIVIMLLDGRYAMQKRSLRRGNLLSKSKGNVLKLEQFIMLI
jgi:hypothetical protein